MIKQVIPAMKRVAFRQWMAITILMLMVAGGMGYMNGLDSLDRTFYDQFMRADSRPARDDIIIVAIDDYSISKLGRWPWERGLHAKLLNRIMKANPLAIGLDIIMPEPEQDQPASQHANDRALTKALAASKLTVLPMVVASAGPGLKALPPMADFLNAARGIGHIHLELDPDGIVRSVFLQEGQENKWWPHFSVALASVAGQKITDASGNLPGARVAPPPTRQRDRFPRPLATRLSDAYSVRRQQRPFPLGALCCSAAR
ncbi:CHASE2 domain-containing protein [Collimonas sp.]|jgi:CHASE2 domain-containing sensor protein|uniref:CHASE2 domain-containing protein n=1 Tax=Collimonas sp. TaxID=1963772 RepID=UPI0037C01D97